MPPLIPQAQRQVASTALPSPRLSTASAPEHADLGNVTEVLGQVLEKRRAKANQIATLDADAELAALETDLLYNPQTGALTRKGKESFDQPEKVREAWTKSVSEIEGRLVNEDQRLAFHERVVAREADLDRAVQRHVAGEIESYEKDTVNGYLTKERNAALANYQDADRVEKSVQRQIAAFRDFATGQLPPEQIAAMVDEITSKTYSGVIEVMLANEQDQRAAEYFADVKEFIHGADSISVQNALKEGTLRGESQRMADELVAKYPDRATAMEQIPEIQDPKLRDAVEDRIRRHFDQQKEIEQEMRNDLYMQATNLIDQFPGRPARDVIPPGDWSKLSLDMRRALEDRSTDVTNDDKAWLDLLQQSPEKIGRLTRAEFEVTFWSKFDRSHRVRAEELWLQTRSLEARDPKLSNTLTFKDRVDNTIRLGKFEGITADKPFADFNKDERAFYAWFEGEAAKRVEQYELTQLGGKRYATADEMQKIIDQLAYSRVFIDKTWGDKKKLTALVRPDEIGKAYFKPDQIPVATYNSFANLIKGKGKRVSEMKIGRLYAAQMFDGRPWQEQLDDPSSAVNAILNER